MAVFTNQKFGKDDRIPLDGNVYHHCAFDHSTVTYSGTGPFDVTGSSFDGCHFLLEGPATMTAGFLKWLWKQGGIGIVSDIIYDVTDGEGIPPRGKDRKGLDLPPMGLEG